MKKLLVFVCVAAILAFGSAAMAASGGHVSNSYKEIVITSADVKVTNAEIVSVEPISLANTQSAISGKTFVTSNSDWRANILTGLTLNLNNYSGSGNIVLTLTPANVPSAAPTFAWILPSTPGATEFQRYPVTTSSNASTGYMTVTISNVDFAAYFSVNNIFLGTQEHTGSDSGSSGCNAGAAPLMLLLGALPLLYFRKK
ncbi:MAG: Synerg-CTERM sorting domain-containing protein [Synergistaceae bacterium]|nr:Synerg-CTERM sorting domain-containing protein [Synergistaceae bacterium]